MVLTCERTKAIAIVESFFRDNAAKLADEVMKGLVEMKVMDVVDTRMKAYMESIFRKDAAKLVDEATGKLIEMKAFMGSISREGATEFAGTTAIDVVSIEMLAECFIGNPFIDSYFMECFRRGLFHGLNYMVRTQKMRVRTRVRI